MLNDTIIKAGKKGHDYLEEVISPMKNDDSCYKIGSATYVVERIYTGNKTVRQVLVEEIISAAKQDSYFDHFTKKML